MISSAMYYKLFGELALNCLTVGQFELMVRNNCELADIDAPSKEQLATIYAKSHKEGLLCQH